MLALWQPLNLLVMAVTGAYVVWAMRRTDLRTAVLLLAIYVRYTSAGLSQYTVPQWIGPLSINAMTSLAIIAGGVFLITPREVALRALWPFHVYIAVCVLSAAVNGAPGPATRVILNWTYMLIVALLIRSAIRRHGCDHVMRLLLPVFVMPIVLGLLSYAVGFKKFSEFDGSISYIGGYLHEATFSVIVFTSLLISLLIKWRNTGIKIASIAVAVLAILLANYRTTIIALLPLIAVIALSSFRSLTPPRFRASAGALGLLVAMVLFPLFVANIPNRYEDLVTVITSGGVDLTDPESLTRTERAIFSSRFQLWSLYISDYLAGDVVIRLLGYGPGTFETTLVMHAHNNYISDLHQIGIIGLMALMLLHANVIVRAALLKDRHYAATLIAGQLGLMIIGLATTPFNIIEGLIAYAVLLGTTLGVTPPPRDAPVQRWFARPVAPAAE